MKELLKSMDAKLSELRHASETEVCSSIRIECKDMARGFGLALHMLKMHIHKNDEPGYTCHFCHQKGCGLGHDCN